MQVGLNIVTNILDFDDSYPLLTKYEVSTCYKDTEKLYFSLRFPGEKTFLLLELGMISL